jgi:hypothetical protein
MEALLGFQQSAQAAAKSRLLVGNHNSDRMEIIVHADSPRRMLSASRVGWV